MDLSSSHGASLIAINDIVYSQGDSSINNSGSHSAPNVVDSLGGDLLSQRNGAGGLLELAAYHPGGHAHLQAGHGHAQAHSDASSDNAGSHGHGHGHGRGHARPVHEVEPGVALKPGEVGPARQLPTQHGFVQAMKNYWQQLTSAKSHHHFFSAFPPVYSSMDDPRAASDTPPAVPTSFPSAGKLPSLKDMLDASKDLNRVVSFDKSKPDFKVDEINEIEFKKRYAAESLEVGKGYGLNSDHMANLVKRIYAFEGGGWGTHYTLSSMPQGLMADNQFQARLNFHPASSAMGYNQLLIKTTVNDIKQHGDLIAGRLDAQAATDPGRAAILHGKAQFVHNLQDFLNHKNAPHFAKGAKVKPFREAQSKVETAVQALNLDGDIGPIIQSQEINQLLKYSASNKFGEDLNVKAADRTTHAKEYDQLPPQKKASAIAQLFDLIKPQEIHKDNPALDAPFYAVKEELRNKVASLGPAGLDHRLEREKLNDAEFRMMNGQVMTIRRYGGAGGPLSPEARALLDRMTYDYFGGFSADKLQAASLEMANLAGPGSAQLMLKKENSLFPTSNFFAKDGYVGNPVTSRRSADELLLQIDRIMHGPNSDPNKPGMAQFDAVFNYLEQREAHKKPGT